MLDSESLDELDYALVNALQYVPRASWSQLGSVLGTNAATVARRWTRLVDAGNAWVSCHPGLGEGPASFGVIVEADCAPGTVETVAAALVDDPHVITVDRTTGARDLLITLLAKDVAALSRYMSFRLERLPGIVATRTQPITAVYTLGSNWRLDRLNPQQRAALLGHRTAEQCQDAPAPLLTEADHALIRVLAEDGRLPLVDLADRLGTTPVTARRRLARLEASGALLFRAELARQLSGWPVGVTLWASVPAAEQEQISRAVAGLREVRLCAALSGPHNLLVTAWLRTVDEVQRLETQLAQRLPRLAIADRSITLWTMKLGGQVLDPYGRRLRSVPVGPWQDTDAANMEDKVVQRLRELG